MSYASKFQIIPAIDLRDGKCVRLQQGDYNRQTVYATSPADAARAWEAAGAPLIHLVDLDGAKAGEPRNLASIAEICRAVRIPCELGGGLRTAEHLAAAFDAGVARAILGTRIAEEPQLTAALVARFGAERLVAGIDARDGKVAVRGWLEEGGQEAVALAEYLVTQGMTRIIYTDIRTDGMFTGPNLPELRRLCAAVPGAQVIASGGVGEVAHISQLTGLGLATLEGVIVGKALYDGRLTYADLLSARG